MPERLYSRDEVTQALVQAGVSKDVIMEAFTIIFDADIKRLQKLRSGKA